MSQYHRPLSKQQQQTTNNHKLTPSQPTSTPTTPTNLPPTPTMQQRPSSSSSTMLTSTTTTITKSNSTTVMPPPPPPTHLHQKQKLSNNNNRNTTNHNNHNNHNTTNNNNNNNRNTTNNSNHLSFQKRTIMTTNPTHNSSNNSNTNNNNNNNNNNNSSHSSSSGSGNLLTNTIQRFSNNIPHLNSGGNSNNNNNNNSTSSDSTKDISQQIFYIIQFCINQLLRYDMRYELSQANKKQELPIIPNCDTIIQFKDYFPAQFRKIREQLLQSEFTSNYSSSKSSSGGDNVTSNNNNYTSTQLEQLFVESFRETYFKQMNSKSGAMFGITNDHRFIVKTLTKNEAKFLRDQFLTSYLSHLSGRSSFLSRFYGLFRMTVDGNLRRFVVMNHLFSVDADDMDEMYDLKGSTLGRQARDGETTLKDQDLINRNRFFHIGPQMKQLVMLQLKNDCAFLESHKLMDYSLLVGVLKASTARKLGLHVPQLSSQQAPQQQQHSSSSSSSRPPASPRNNTTTTNSNGLLSASSSSASGTSSASSIRSPSPLKSHSLPKSSSSASLTRSYSMNTNSNTNTLHNSNNNNNSKSKTPPIPSHLRNASSSENSTTTTTDLSIKSRSKIFSGDGSAGAVNNNRTTSPSTIRSLPQQKYASTTTITPVKPSSSLSDRNASPSSSSSATNGGSNVNDIVQMFNRNRASLTGRTDAATLSDTPSSPHLSLPRSNTAPPVSMHKAAVSSHNHAVSPSVDVTPPTTPSNNNSAATDGKFMRSKSIFDSVSSAFSTMSAATTNLLGPREEVERSQVKIVHLNVEKTFDTISSSPLLLSNSSNRLKQISSVDGSEIYFFGLIDFLGHYDIRKMTQNLISTDREQVSSVPPEQYSLRMLQFVEQRLR